MSVVNHYRLQRLLPSVLRHNRRRIHVCLLLTTTDRSAYCPTNEMKLETEKEIEYKSTIMEMKNIIKNQERVIEQLMFDMLNIKIDIEEVDEVDEVSKV